MLVCVRVVCVCLNDSRARRTSWRTCVVPFIRKSVESACRRGWHGDCVTRRKSLQSDSERRNSFEGFFLVEVMKRGNHCLIGTLFVKILYQSVEKVCEQQQIKIFMLASFQVVVQKPCKAVQFRRKGIWRLSGPCVDCTVLWMNLFKKFAMKCTQVYSMGSLPQCRYLKDYAYKDQYNL